MRLAWVVDKGVWEHADADDSSVTEILGVWKLSRVVNLNMYCELVMIICIERCEYEYVSNFGCQWDAGSMQVIESCEYQYVLWIGNGDMYQGMWIWICIEGYEFKCVSIFVKLNIYIVET